MELNISNAVRNDNIFYWNIPFENYKIELVNVITNEQVFYAKYNYLNEGVEQLLESGRSDGCPAVFTGQFSVFFFNFSPTFPISNIESIKINIVSVSPN